MDIQQLRIFVTVSETQHMTRAAEQLALTQPAVSSAIAALERRYKAHLFNRVGRGIELTETGERFLTEALAVLDRVEAATAVLEDAADTPTGRINIVCSQVIGGYWLPKRAAAFSAAFPSVKLHIDANKGEDAVKAVLAGDADLAFVSRANDPALVAHIVASDQILLLRAVGTDFLQPPIRRKDIIATPWFLRADGSDAQSAIAEFLQARNIGIHELKTSLVLPSNEAVREAIEAGAGVGVISEHAARNSVAARRLEPIRAHIPLRSFSAAYHKDRRLTRAQQAFLTFVKDQYVTDDDWDAAHWFPAT